eukprot:EG_transcript_6310
MAAEQLADKLLRLVDEKVPEWNFQNTRLGPEGAQSLAASLKRSDTARLLHLTNSKIGPEGARALAAALRGNGTLQWIDLAGNKLGPEGTHVLAEALNGNATLQRMSLANNQCADQGSRALATMLRGNRRLEQFHLGNNGIGPDGAAALAKALRENTVLQRLNMEGNRLGPDGARVLASALPANSALRFLFLQNNGLGPEGAAALAASLPGCTTLLQLNLGSNGVGLAGAQALAVALRANTTLQELGLLDSGIDTATAAALASALEGNTTLRQLYLQRNTIDQDILDMINGLLCRNQALASSPPAIASSSSPTGMAAEAPPERKHNRWGDGLEAPAAGTRVFFPNGWVPRRDAAEAIGAFGHDAAKLAYVLARGQQIAVDLARVNVAVDAEEAAVVFAYTQEDPVVRLYAQCNEACRTAGPAAETRLALYRDYLHYLAQALSGLPKFVGTAYRGVRTLMPPGCYEVGQTVTWQPFTSTTRSATCTVPFLGQNGRQLDGSLFVLHVKAGRDVSDFSEYPHEREVLLGLNSVWRVTGRCSSETEKKAVVPELGGYELTHLDVYLLKQL